MAYVTNISAYTINIRASYWRTFSTRDESVDDDLRPVEEVSELCLPDGQVARTLNAETILKPQHRLFTQGTVGNLKWCKYNKYMYTCTYQEIIKCWIHLAE